jgi:hypothetical protein
MVENRDGDRRNESFMLLSAFIHPIPAFTGAALERAYFVATRRNLVRPHDRSNEQ